MRTVRPGQSANPSWQNLSPNNLIFNHSITPALQVITCVCRTPARTQRYLDLADQTHQVAGWIIPRSEALLQGCLLGNEALDLELKSRIALKAIRPEIASDPRVLSRFRREVQLTRIITHPNVCRTFDIERHSQSSDGEINGVGDLTFLTMELLEGETLASLIRRHGRCSTAEALPIVLQMIDALAAAVPRVASRVTEAAGAPT